MVIQDFPTHAWLAAVQLMSDIVIIASFIHGLTAAPNRTCADSHARWPPGSTSAAAAFEQRRQHAAGTQGCGVQGVSTRSSPAYA